MKSSVKHNRSQKRQLGQFMTPDNLAKEKISHFSFSINDTILEPSYGEGSFIFAIVDKFFEAYIKEGYTNEKEIYNLIFSNNLYGVELDEELYKKTNDIILQKYGCNFTNSFNNDFLLQEFEVKFNYIIGNPPFGGTVNMLHQDKLDKEFGKRYGIKIKKETYSFFMIKSIDILKDNGTLLFISSDTFLTINTMKGLRYFLLKKGNIELNKINYFSEETKYGMVTIEFKKVNELLPTINIYDKKVKREVIELSPNCSFNMEDKFSTFFEGKLLSEYILCSSGMTVGKNEYFIRDIKKDNKGLYIEEPFDFIYFQDKITLEKEKEKARLGKIGQNKIEEIIEKEKNGETQENIKIIEKDNIEKIYLPSEDYCFYNKAINDIIFTEPRFVVFWKDNGKAVYTYKNNGNWYLHGVGGKKFFKKEGFVWALRGKKITARYLPKGYILDSGSPIGILKEGIDNNELYFIIGWLLSDLANKILKEVINHTLNIQGKDVERLPYPYWINNTDKETIIKVVKDNIDNKMKGINIDNKIILEKINEVFKY